MSENRFDSDPFIKLKRDKLSDGEIQAFSLSDNDKVMRKDNVIVRFVHIGKRFTGELQFKIEHPKKDIWYSAIENTMLSNDRITMLTYSQREIVDYPISITLEEEESHELIINEFHRIIMSNKPEGI